MAQETEIMLMCRVLAKKTQGRGHRHSSEDGVLSHTHIAGTSASCVWGWAAGPVWGNSTSGLSSHALPSLCSPSHSKNMTLQERNEATSASSQDDSSAPPRQREKQPQDESQQPGRSPWSLHCGLPPYTAHSIHSLFHLFSSCIAFQCDGHCPTGPMDVR